MNTKNIHHMPIHSLLLSIFMFFALIPVFTVFIFKPISTTTTQQVLGVNTTLVDNVSISSTKTDGVINFKYNLTAYEVKTINIKGNNVYFKNSYPGLLVKNYGNYFELVNTSSNSYLIEGVVY